MLRINGKDSSKITVAVALTLTYALPFACMAYISERYNIVFN